MKTKDPQKDLPKAGNYGTGPDKNLLMTDLVCKPPVKSVTIDGKTVESRFNPVAIKSRYQARLKAGK